MVQFIRDYAKIFELCGMRFGGYYAGSHDRIISEGLDKASNFQ